MKTQETTKNIRLMTIEEEQLRFGYLQDNIQQKEYSLKAGYKFIADTFFKHKIPTEAETEYAINYIEDELMSNKEFLNNNETLVSKEKILADIFKKNGLDKKIYSRREIEDLFSSYAYIVMGQPAFLTGITVTREDFAALLLLREITHHLDFKELFLD